MIKQSFIAMMKGLRCSFSHHGALFLDLIFFIFPLPFGPKLYKLCFRCAIIVR